MSIILIGDIVEENGLTIARNNRRKQHNIPLGSLVEIFDPDEDKWKEPEDFKHGLRLWVAGHTRGCDGTPLYVLSFNKNAYAKYEELRKEAETGDQLAAYLVQYNSGQLDNGYSEESLIVIKAHQAK